MQIQSQRENYGLPKQILATRTPYPQQSSSIKRTIHLFYAYAKEDIELAMKLEAHLSILQRQGIIRTWTPWMMVPGKEFQRELIKQLEQADIHLLLLSADFFSSPECQFIEEQVLAQSVANKTVLIPVILRATDWQSSALGRLMPLPTNGKPVASWRDRDNAFLDIVQGIRTAIDALI